MLCPNLYQGVCKPNCPYEHSLVNINKNDIVRELNNFGPNKYRERFGVILTKGGVSLLIKCNSNKEWDDSCEPKWTFPKTLFDPEQDIDPIDTAIRAFTTKTGLFVRREWLVYGYSIREGPTHHTFYFLDLNKFKYTDLDTMYPLDNSMKVEYRWMTATEDYRPTHNLCISGKELCYSVQRFLGRRFDKKTKDVEKMTIITIPI